MVPKVDSETGFSAVSATKLATGSPVMTGMEMPEPGRFTRWARRMTADSSTVAAQISALCSGVSTMPVVPRLMSMGLVARAMVAPFC